MDLDIDQSLLQYLDMYNTRAIYLGMHAAPVTLDKEVRKCLPVDGKARDFEDS